MTASSRDLFRLDAIAVYHAVSNGTPITKLRKYCDHDLETLRRLYDFGRTLHQKQHRLALKATHPTPETIQ